MFNYQQSINSSINQKSCRTSTSNAIKKHFNILFHRLTDNTNVTGSIGNETVQ